MSNTTHGGYRITPSNNMLAYDKLPAELREVHRNCIFDFAVPPDLTSLRKGATVSSLIDVLMYSDVDAARKDAKRNWKTQRDEYLAAQRGRRRRDWLDKPPRSRL